MPELEWASDGRFVDRDRDIEVANDPDEDEYTTHDVPEDAVDAYLERPGWQQPGENEDEDDGGTADEESAGDESTEDADDVDQLLEGTVDEVSEDLESGAYDDRLDDIEERAERQGVQDAVDDRRNTSDDEDEG